MLNRRGSWLAGGITVVVLALVVAWVLFVPSADWLAHHDVGSATGSLHETALDNARGRLLTLGAGLFAAGALVFTARNFAVSRRTLEVTEQGQVTDRYTKAIEQLGSDKLDVRIGGIYALERVARDSIRDHPTVMEVLTAFIREHSRETCPEPDSDVQIRSIRPDVQAAATVVGRRDPAQDVQRIDLSRANLTGAALTGANLSGAYLSSAVLSLAGLSSAVLTGADLTDANLADTNLSGANLCRAALPGADLDGANLSRADLTAANLTGAALPGAVLADTYLSGANLTRADLTGADLDGADLTGVDLTAAVMTPHDVIPEGWQRGSDSGRLERTDTSSDGPPG